MIGGAVHGSGGAGLGRHNSAPQEADDARPGASRGLMASGIEDQTAEITAMARASGHKAPVRHVYASPPPGAGWGEKEWGEYWTLYERAMGLEKSPFSEAIHDKPGEHGREAHRHRVYLATTERGTLVRIGHDYARQEAVSRIMEFRTGQPFVKGAHNIRAMAIAEQLGFPEVAQAMRDHGLNQGQRARADTTPMERAQQERTKVTKADVARLTAQAWQASDNGQAFSHALRDAGLILAMGDKSPIVIDQTGNSHSVSRMLAMWARSQDEPSPKAQDVAARLAGIELPSLDDARAQDAQAPVEVAPNPMPVPVPPGGGQPAPIPVVVEVPTSQDMTPVTMATPSKNDDQQIPAAASAKGPSSKSGGGGGRGASSPSEPQASPLPSLDVGNGPGEPPGHNATPEQRAQFAAKLAAYEEKKTKAWQAWLRAWDAQNKPKSKGTTAGGGDVGIDEKGIREAATALVRSIENAVERGVAVRTFEAAWTAFRGDNTQGCRPEEPSRDSSAPERSQGGPGDGHSRRDEPAQGRSRPSGDAGNLERAGDGSPEPTRDERADFRTPTKLEAALTHARIDASISIADPSALRAEMRGPCSLAGLEGRERKNRLNELNSELHAEFRASQRQDFSEAVARERMRSHPLAVAIRGGGRHLHPDERARAWTDIEAAKQALVVRLKEAQKANSKAAFRQFVEFRSHTDARAAAVWEEMKIVMARNAKIAAELARADEKIAVLRASEPKGEMDPDKAARAAKTALYEPLREAQSQLNDARSEFEKTPPPKGWRWWNPAAHTRYAAAKTAVEMAHARVSATTPHYLDIDRVEGQARNGAVLLSREHGRWMEGPGKDLRTLEHGVQRIRDALENRDFRVRDSILTGGLEAALDLLRKRDADEQRKREIEEARAAKHGNIYGFPDRQNNVPGMPAPRMG